MDMISANTHQLGPQLVHRLIPQSCLTLTWRDGLAGDLLSQDEGDGSCGLVDR